jgi:hypothetical protein
VQELEGLRLAVGRLLRKLPATFHNDPDYKLLRPLAEHKRHITIAHLINRRLAGSTNSKDYEFSRTTVRQLWQAGLDDVRRTISHRAWLEARELVEGVRIVHNWREEIDGVHQRGIFAQLVNAGIVTGFKSNQHVGISLPRQLPQNRVQRPGTQLRRSTSCLDHGRQFHGVGQVTPRCTALRL